RPFPQSSTQTLAAGIALSGSGAGIALSGTGSITANNCQVESNTTICANSGANPSDVITTKYLSYGSGTNPASSNCTISPPSGTSSVHISKATASDPLAGNSEVSGATSRISTVASITSPTAPTRRKCGHIQIQQHHRVVADGLHDEFVEFSVGGYMHRCRPIQFRCPFG